MSQGAKNTITRLAMPATVRASVPLRFFSHPDGQIFPHHLVSDSRNATPQESGKMPKDIQHMLAGAIIG